MKNSRNYSKCVNGLAKHGFIKQSMDELNRNHVYRILISAYERMDRLEDFITEYTDYDGEKVHNLLYPEEKDWLKKSDEK